MIRSTTKCQRGKGGTRCLRAFSAHIGPKHLCPDGSGRTFYVNRNQGQASFSPEEVHALSVILELLQKGQSETKLGRKVFRALVSVPAFTSVAKKILLMSRRVRAMRGVR